MLIDDIRHAVRSLRRQPSLVLLVVATLAIGIGATTAVFSVANALVLQDLPFPEPHRLVALGERNINGPMRGRSNTALPNLMDWKAASPAMQYAAGWTPVEFNVAGPAGAERLSGGRMTPEMFAVLGVPLTRGRTFTATEGAPGTTVTILAESAWRQFHNRREDVIGQTVVIDGAAHEVVGVVPDIPGIEAKVWLPVPDAMGSIRRNHAFRAMARLTTDGTIEQLQQQIDASAVALEQAYPDTNKGWRGEALPLQSALTEDVTIVVSLMAVAVGALLLLASANTANLLGARASSMRHEFAVRAALGAQRSRLMRQVLTESTLLALSGALVGLALAYALTSTVTTVVSREVALWSTPAVDGATLGFSILLAIVVAMLFGMWPAIVAGRQRATGALQERPTTSPRAGRRTRSTLAVVQVALASLLLVATGLLLSSLRAALMADPGFDPSNTMSFRVSPPRAAYPDPPALSAYYDRLVERLRAMPGVAAIGAVNGVPLGSSNTVRGVLRLDEPKPERGVMGRLSLYQIATPGYFAALGTSLRGRDFDATDTAGSEPVAIVNQALADQMFPGREAIGQFIHVYTDEAMPRRIVGVVATIRHMALDEDTYNQYFVPVPQAPQRAMSIVIRTGAGFDAGAVRAAAQAIDPTLPLFEVRTLDQVMSQSLAERRALTALVAAFGLVALVLATIGVYGVVAISVSERRRELGIRIALGAQRGRVVGLVLRQALTLTTAGLVIGLGASMAGTEVLAEFTFGVTPLDVTTRVMVVLLLLATTAAASYSPARRASRVQPVEALKG